MSHKKLDDIIMMKIIIPCMQCNANVGVVFIVTGDGFYEATCPNNHNIKYILQEQLFELLFDIGLHAIKDDYFREAVSSFAASLERFYEFYIKLIAYRNGKEEKEIELSWKAIKNQSERQMGAFIFTYLNENGKSPNVLDNRNVSFRNNVIHRGAIPTKELAVEFGQSVLDIVNPIIRDLKINSSKELAESVFRHQDEVRKKFGVTNSGISIPTVISLSRAVGYDSSVQDALRVIEWRSS